MVVRAVGYTTNGVTKQENIDCGDMDRQGKVGVVHGTSGAGSVTNSDCGGAIYSTSR